MSRLGFAARHFIAGTRRSSVAPLHELVKGVEIRSSFAATKDLAVCKAERFSATRVATNSLLCRATALLSERGHRRGYVSVSVHRLILPIASHGITSIPNRASTVPESRALHVTNASARPLTAVSSPSRHPYPAMAAATDAAAGPPQGFFKKWH
jgi:hypothetical protein